MSDAYDTDDIDIDWRAQDAVQIGQIEMPQFTLCGEASLSDYTEDYISKLPNFGMTEILYGVPFSYVTMFYVYI